MILERNTIGERKNSREEELERTYSALAPPLENLNLRCART